MQQTSRPPHLPEDVLFFALPAHLDWSAYVALLSAAKRIRGNEPAILAGIARLHARRARRVLESPASAEAKFAPAPRVFVLNDTSREFFLVHSVRMLWYALKALYVHGRWRPGDAVRAVSEPPRAEAVVYNGVVVL